MAVLRATLLCCAWAAVARGGSRILRSSGRSLRPFGRVHRRSPGTRGGALATVPGALAAAAFDQASAPAPYGASAPAAEEASAPAADEASDAAPDAYDGNGTPYPGDLLKGYDKEIAPFEEDGTVTVRLAFHAVKMMSLDHVGQTLTIAGWIRQYWYDPRLRWESRGEGKSDEFVAVESDKIWKPDTALTNSVDFNYNEHCQDVAVRVLRGHGDYNVFWARPCLLTTKCDVTLDFYPFDINTCSLIFQPWSDFFVRLSSKLDDMTSDITIPEFDVTMLKERFDEQHFFQETLPGITFSSASVKFRIERHGHFYVVNYICPIVLMLLMSWLSLAIPVKNSDRVQFMVTVMLTVMTVNFVTAEKRPASDEDTWLDDFQTLSLLVATLVTAYTVSLYRFAPQSDWSEERSQRRMPLMKFADRVARVVFGVVLLGMAIGLYINLKIHDAAGGKDVSGKATIICIIMVLGISCGMMLFIFLTWFPQSWYTNNLRKLEDWRWLRETRQELPEIDVDVEPHPDNHDAKLHHSRTSRF